MAGKYKDVVLLSEISVNTAFEAEHPFFKYTRIY